MSMSDENAMTGGAAGPDDRERWMAAVTSELAIPAEVLARVSDPLLDMVRDVAHQVNRPSAPLTAFLVGLASGSAAATEGTNLAVEVRSRVERVERLIEAWVPAPGA